MSHSFNRYEQIKENDPTNRNISSEYEGKTYDGFYTEESHARNICFVWHNNNRIFMNYSFLVSGEYSPDTNTIILTFTTHIFILKGVNLESLFYDFMDQLSKQIVCKDVRYNLIGESERFSVNEIQMTTIANK